MRALPSQHMILTPGPVNTSFLTLTPKVSDAPMMSNLSGRVNPDLAGGSRLCGDHHGRRIADVLWRVGLLPDGPKTPRSVHRIKLTLSRCRNVAKRAYSAHVHRDLEWVDMVTVL